MFQNQSLGALRGFYPRAQLQGGFLVILSKIAPEGPTGCYLWEILLMEPFFDRHLAGVAATFGTCYTEILIT